MAVNSTRTSPGYTIADVEALTDLVDGYYRAHSLLREHGIDRGQTTELEEWQQLLFNYLRKSELLKCNDPGKMLVKFREKRADIKNIYMRFREFIDCLECNPKVKQDIGARMERWIETLDANFEELRKGLCPILVAGETGAGKSSFINLLIGVDILPTDDALSTTSCICEIHHSEKKEVTAYLTEPRLSNSHRHASPDYDYVDLTNKTVDEVRQILDGFAHEQNDRGNGGEYKRVVLKWPIPFLTAGLYLVDSPGLGENSVMDERVKSFVDEAIAFIYIINVDIGGGLSEGRVETLLSMENNKTNTANLQMFDPRSALFIINKWDKLSEENRTITKGFFLDRLKKRWPELNEKEQIHYLSVKMIRRIVNCGGGVPMEYNSFLGTFYKFLENGLDIMVTRHLQWLDYLLNHADTCVQTPLTKAKLNNKLLNERTAKITKCLTKLRDSSKKVVTRLNKLLNDKVKMIAVALCKHMKEPDTFKNINRILMMNAELLPDENNMDLNKAIARDFIKSLLFSETANWEEKTNMFLNAKTEVRDKLMSEFEFVDKKLAEIEAEMKGVSRYTAQPLKSKVYRNDGDQKYPVFSQVERMVIGITSPLWFPLAVLAGVLMAPVVGGYTLYSQLSAKYHLIKFRRDRSKALGRWLSKVLSGITEEGIQRDIIIEQMADVVAFIKKFEENVPKLIASNEKLMAQAVDTQAKTEEILLQYDPLRIKLDAAYGLRNMYCYKYMISSEENVYIEKDVVKNQRFLANGTFADVYSGFLNDKLIAVKVFKRPVTENTVTDILLERDLLSTVRHVNIVEMYGTICYIDGDTRYCSFVMELCDSTLKRAIFEHPERVPALQEVSTSSRRDALLYCCDKVLQVCHALVYLHENKIVHRDLKLDNILLKDTDGVVKVADLGQSKLTKDMFTQKYVGTPKYTDPVILSEGYVQTEADVYSLAMILWEVWYGCEIFANLSWDDEFEEKVKHGHRPQFDLAEKVAAFTDYADLIRECWQSDPFSRPSASDCRLLLEQIRNAVQAGDNCDTLCFTRTHQSSRSGSFTLVSDSSITSNHGELSSFENINSYHSECRKTSQFVPKVVLESSGRGRHNVRVFDLSSQERFNSSASNISAPSDYADEEALTPVFTDVPYDNPFSYAASVFYIKI